MKLLQAIHQFLNRVENKIKKIAVQDKFKRYKSMIVDGHIFENLPMKVTRDMSANPHEFFSHYDAYSVWLMKKIKENGGGNILDVGNLKVTNALIALDNNLTSLVLMDCEDKISDVKYVIQDVGKPLKFNNNSFDIFSSSVSLHLVGLARYGDELNPNALIHFIKELDRVMKEKSELIFSISYGKNCLTFNEGWKFDIETLKKLFNKYELIDWLIDNHSSHTVKDYTDRFTKDLSLEGWEEGEYRVIFLHFKR